MRFAVPVFSALTSPTSLRRMAAHGTRRLYSFTICGLVFSLLMSVPSPAQEKRVALVIGNSAYKSVNSLRNPVEDAAAMQVALQRMGFQLTVGLDLNLEGFRSKVLEFNKASRNADIALLFYAGHGVQYGDQNYLLPIDIEVKSQEDVTTKSVALNEVLEIMARAKASVIFLDACRDSPQFRTVGKGTGNSSQLGWLFNRGLAAINTRQDDRFVGFAAAPGAVAADGNGKNSPFTEALVRNISKPNVEIAAMFTAVTASVLAATNRRQRPESVNALSRPLYLNPTDSSLTETKEASPTGDDKAPVVGLSSDTEFWMAIRDANDPLSFETYLKEFPKGRFAILAKRKFDELKQQIAAAEKRVRPSTADAQNTESELLSATGIARITSDHPKEEAQRSARALARARLIQSKLNSAQANLPAIVSTTADAASLLGAFSRGIPYDEEWTTFPAASGEVKVELRAKMRPLPNLSERRLSGGLETTDVVAGKPIRLRVTARKDAEIGVFAWQADDTVLRLYPESLRSQPVVVKAGETLWLPRSNDSYPAIASDNMPGETNNHEAWIVVVGARMTSVQFESLAPTTVTRAIQTSSSRATSTTEFLSRLASIQDPEIEVMVLPYTVRAAR